MATVARLSRWILAGLLACLIVAGNSASAQPPPCRIAVRDSQASGCSDRALSCRLPSLLIAEDLESLAVKKPRYYAPEGQLVVDSRAVCHPAPPRAVSVTITSLATLIAQHVCLQV